MAFDDSQTYYVPSNETNWLFSVKNLEALSRLCSDSKRPRITTTRHRRRRSGDSIRIEPLAESSHHVYFPNLGH